MRRYLIIALRSIVMAIACLVISQIILRRVIKRKPGPMPARSASLLYGSLRHKFFGPPERIVERAGVTPGMRVLEIGPGPGNFTAALARRVAQHGKQGSVTCVELQPEMIAILRQRLEREQLNNIEIMQGDAQQLSLPDASFDLIFLVTVVGEILDKEALFCECERVLKPGGILAVTEQITDPDFCPPKVSRTLAAMNGLTDAGYLGKPWWIYTARYLKPTTKQASPSLVAAK